MLRRLASPVHSFRSPRSRTNYTAAHTANPPLRILFCGSDSFSITALRKLNDARKKDARFIESIDVVHRPPKPYGRGLTVKRSVPISESANALGLPSHPIDTFTGWTPPNPYNLVIAVSFGLLVPPRILSAAQYPGLNLHPSLLPDLYGPAPIHHALLKNRTHTGVSIQTLHPTKFDGGTIIAQTPSPGIEVWPGARVPELYEKLGNAAAVLLLQVLRQRTFIDPRDRGWYASSGGPVEHAPKVGKKFQYFDLTTAKAGDVLKQLHDMEQVFTIMGDGKRVIFHELEAYEEDDGTHPDVGIFAANGHLLARTCDGKLLRIIRTTVGGGKKDGGNEYLKQRWLLGWPVRRQPKNAKQPPEAEPNEAEPQSKEAGS